MQPTTMSVEEIQVRLPEIIAALSPGHEVIITQQNQPVAKLTRECLAARQPRQSGSAEGKLLILIEDEEPLEGFQEYMP